MLSLSTQKRYPQHSQKIAYIDLFAGPGRYKDSTQSTPLRILTNAIEKPDLRERLVTIFNDKDEKNSSDLQNTIAEIPGIETLKYKPMVYNQEVGEEKAIALGNELNGKNSSQRELLIVEELCQALKAYGSRYVLPFRFKNDRGKRTSHHLIFVSKHFRGYEIMKDIMARESTSDTQGVPSFEYNPADFLPQQTLLFQLSRPFDDLKEDLLDKFRGQRFTMQELYEKHNVDKGSEFAGNSHFQCNHCYKNQCE